MMSLAKRRRVSDPAATPAAIPSATVSSSNVSNGNATSPLDLADVESKLSHVSKLVLVQLQKQNSEEVVDALKQIFQMIPEAEEDPSQEEHKECLKHLTWTGAPAMMVLTMHKWPTDETVQYWCCSCLMLLAYNYKKEGSCAIVELGGVEAIVTALKAFPDSLGIQKRGCTALVNLFYELDEDSLPTKILQEAQRFVVELGGLELLRKAMSNFTEDTEYQAECCGLLCKLAQQGEFKEALTTTGAVVAVSTALQHHSDNEEVNDHGNDFMKAMFFKKDD